MTMAEPVAFEAIGYDDIPAWRDDDHAAAFSAFVASCGAVVKTHSLDVAPPASRALATLCRSVLGGASRVSMVTREDARVFFESHFRPHRVRSQIPGLLTGYYEPLVCGSRTPTAEFHVPIYRRPADLWNLVPESERASKPSSFTHMRKTDRGLEPYLTRAEIEEGGLHGQGLELLYLADPIDVFFMQVQGSGQIALPDGEKIRVAYDGKNGYPYTSIGRVLIDMGEVPAEAASLETLKDWLRANPGRGKIVMQKNQSYVFFRELPDALGPLGTNDIPLTEGRSLAIDTAFHLLGTPIYVDAPDLVHAADANGFRRLMIAHDVGSAIKGPERGDIYFGSGEVAGQLAGITKHQGHFIVLLPNGTSPPATGNAP